LTHSTSIAVLVFQFSLTPITKSLLYIPLGEFLEAHTKVMNDGKTMMNGRLATKTRPCILHSTGSLHYGQKLLPIISPGSVLLSKCSRLKGFATWSDKEAMTCWGNSIQTSKHSELELAGLTWCFSNS
jgi:hypothetical protein